MRSTYELQASDFVELDLSFPQLTSWVPQRAYGPKMAPDMYTSVIITDGARILHTVHTPSIKCFCYAKWFRMPTRLFVMELRYPLFTVYTPSHYKSQRGSVQKKVPGYFYSLQTTTKMLCYATIGNVKLFAMELSYIYCLHPITFQQSRQETFRTLGQATSTVYTP